MPRERRRRVCITKRRTCRIMYRESAALRGEVNAENEEDLRNSLIIAVRYYATR
jgi:hypothetical protein